MFIDIVSHHPAIVLYLALAVVYSMLALEAWCETHRKASVLYGCSGVLHMGLAVCQMVG